MSDTPAQPPIPTAFASVGVIAKLAGVSTQTVRNYVKFGIIKPASVLVCSPGDEGPVRPIFSPDQIEAVVAKIDRMQDSLVKPGRPHPDALTFSELGDRLGMTSKGANLWARRMGRLGKVEIIRGRHESTNIPTLYVIPKK